MKIRKNKGFTLIELIVTVTVMMVLMGIGSYSIGNFAKSRKNLGVRDELVSQIKLAINLSLTNQLPDQSVNLKFVRVIISGRNITVEGVKNDGSVVTGSPYFTKQISPDADLSISVKNNTTTISSFGFAGKSGRLLNSDGTLTDGPIVINVTDGVNSNVFRINDLGIIDNEN